VRLLGVLVVVTVLLGGSAQAKSPPVGIKVCGRAACVTVGDATTWERLPWGSEEPGRQAGPAAPAPFLTVAPAFASGASSTAMYYVPSAAVVRVAGGGGIDETRGPAWFALSPGASPELESAAQQLKPFQVRRVVWASVGTRAVRRPQSYLRLFALAGSPANDPAGPPPALPYWTNDREAWLNAWGPYLKQVDRAWIRIRFGTVPLSPWGDSYNSLWVGRTLDLLKRDGEVLTLSHGVATRLRRGLSLP
jgi:hypothetical protein